MARGHVLWRCVRQWAQVGLLADAVTDSIDDRKPDSNCIYHGNAIANCQLDTVDLIVAVPVPVRNPQQHSDWLSQHYCVVERYG